MRPAERIKNLFNNSKIAVSPKVNDRLLNGTLTAFETSQDARPTTFQPSEWRIIMKSRAMRIAVAAVIVFGVLIGVNHFGVNVSLTNATFAEMTEAINGMPWVHIVYTEQGKEAELSREEWLSNELRILAGRQSNGTIVYWDYGNDEQYVYDPESDTITASYRSGKAFVVAAPYDYLTNHIDYAIRNGGSVIQQEGQYDDIDVKIYEFTFPWKDRSGNDKGTLIIKMTVDKNSGLPIVGERRWSDVNGEVLKEEHLTYSYPKELSLDIYDLGVPLSAKLVDQLPPAGLKRIRKECSRWKEELPSKYIAIETTRYADSGQVYEVSIVYNSDKYQRVNDFSNNGMPLTCPAGSFDEILGWVQEGVSCDRRTDIFYDGQYNYWHEYYGGKWHLNFEPKRYSPRVNLNPSRAMEDVIRPQIVWKGAKTVENDYAKRKNFVCVEGPGGKLTDGTEEIPLWQVVYLNPQRGYRVQRREIYYADDEHSPQTRISLESSDSTWGIPIRVEQVVEYARTACGLWYPMVIERHAVVWHRDGTPFEQHTFRTVYVKTEPEFPQGIFDPESLPR